MPSNLLAALLAAPAVGRGGVAVSAFPAPPTAAARRRPACTGLQAIERLHAPRDGAAGAAGRVYSLADIDRVTRTVADDEWAGLGSVIADCMLETVLDIGDAVLQKMSFVDEITLTNRIAAEVSNAVEKTLQNIRAQEHASFDVGHDLPGELVASLRALLRHELSVLAGVDDEDGSALDGYSAQLSLIAESAVHDAVEEYCGLADSRAPFFSLAHEMENRIRDRRRELLVRHSRGYEGLSDIEDDIRESRRRWTRSELGGGAARSFELGVVTTKLGNGHSREMERKEAVARQRSGLWKALTQDLDGVLMP